VPHKSSRTARYWRKTRARAWLATLRRFQITTEYSFLGVPLPSKESRFEALLIRGLKHGPPRVRQVPQITGVRDCMDVPYELLSNAEFETSYAVFEAIRG